MLLKVRNAQNCTNSLKRVRNNSVFCLRLDQWVSVNYCEYACQAYLRKEVDPTTIPQEETVDNSGSVRDEDGNTIDVTQEDEMVW